MDRTTWSKALAISAAITLLGGCASAPGGPPSPSGAAAAPSGTASAPAASVKPSPVGPAVTLHLADAEDQGRSSQPWIDAFIDQVSKDSGGTITVVPEYNAGGGNEGVPGEIVVAGQVMAGDVELALVPVRGWNDVGVTSLQALEAPLLVDSDALLTAVAADPLVQPLLDRMGDQGLVGLSAWPDDLRHPFTWDQNGSPIVAAADLRDATIFALPSKLQLTILQGLGAKVVSAGSGDVDRMVADGSLRGAESSFNGIRSLSGTPTATGDVVLYPKFQVLAAEDAAFSRLSDAQQAIVRGAAVAARDLAVAKHVPDAQLASEWCALHGRVVLAGADGVRSFQEAAAPVLATLAQDPVTATALDAITRLKAGLTTASPAVQACEPAADPNAPWPSVAPGPDLGFIPDGVYIHAVTEAELSAAGVDPADVAPNAGTWRLQVDGQHGTWTNMQDGHTPGEIVPLDFQLHGDRLRMQQHDHPSFWDVRWSSKDDVLQLEIVGSDWSTAQGAVSLNAYWQGAWTKVE